MNYMYPNQSMYQGQTPMMPNSPAGNFQSCNSSFTMSQQSGFRIVPVASYDEARAVPTSFAGDTLILTDFAHGMIYTKTLDTNTGSSMFHGYKLITDDQKPPVFDPQNEIEKLRSELNEIKKELGIEKGEQS